jgi:hypothetical protein
VGKGKKNSRNLQEISGIIVQKLEIFLKILAITLFGDAVEGLSAGVRTSDKSHYQ